MPVPSTQAPNSPKVTGSDLFGPKRRSICKSYSGPPRKKSIGSSVSPHKPAKRTRNRIPPPQRERILQKYVAGKSLVQISREENRNRETVTRIVRSDEMREHVHRMREAFYGLADSALIALRHALEVEKDAQLAYKILTDIAVIPTAIERQQVQAPTDSKDEQSAVYKIIASLLGGAVARNRFYGLDTIAVEDDLARAGGRVNAEGKIVPIE